ncbi:MAG: sugar porter family MFS transporter [Rhodobacteraceae bacterium]|nr:sugar porter family MFS transporter [Paracoccaceae bacterium]
MTLSRALISLAALAALFGFLFGFDEGIIAGALPFIEQTFEVTPAAEGFMTAAVPLGAVLGVVLAARYSDQFGRRLVLMSCAAVFVVGSIMSGLASGVVSLTIARLVLGIGIGMSALAAPMFLAELAPAAVRGMLVSAFQLLITIGIVASYGVSLALSPLGDWRLMLALGAIPALIALVGIAVSPESPRWLVLRGRDEDAQRTISTLQPRLTDSEVASKVHEIRASLEGTPKAPPWSAFLAPKVRPVVAFAITLFLLQQLSGINAVIYYAPIIMAEAGMEGVSARLGATVGIGLLNVVMTVVAMILVDRVGRRPLLITGFAGAAVSLAIITFAFATPTDDAGLALAGILLYVAFFAVALGPLPWLYMAELFPMRLKTRGIALASTANWSMNFLVVFLFPVVLSAVGASAAFAIFAACCAFGFFYALKYAPETNGVSLEAMEHELAEDAA